MRTITTITNSWLALGLALTGTMLCSAEQRSPSLVPEDTCVLQLDLPSGASVTVDGRDYGTKRTLTFSSLQRGRIYQSKLQARFTSGRQVERTILLQGGWHIRLPLREAEPDRPEIVVQAGGASGNAAFSPDGSLLAIAAGNVTLWDVSTGRLLRTLGDQAVYDNAVAFSPDGQQILAAKSPRYDLKMDFYAASLWDAASGRLLRTFSKGEGRVGHIAFSQSGERIALAGTDKQASPNKVVVWNVGTGAVINEFRPIKPAPQFASIDVTFLALSADGSQAMLGTRWWDKTRDIQLQNEVALWDIAAGTKLRTLIHVSGFYLAPMTVSADWRQLVTRGSEGKLLVWDVQTGAQLRTIEVGRNDNVTYAPDGLQAVTYDYVYHWNDPQLLDLPPKKECWLGAYVRQLNTRESETLGLADPSGLLVELVIPASPAAKAGLKQGDVITKAGKQGVQYPLPFEFLVRSREPGDELALSLIRQGLPQEARIILESAPPDAEFIAALTRLAEAGNARAQTLLGVNYKIGTRVPKDYATALSWLRLAAGQGEANAQYHIGDFYANGLGVPSDKVEAVRWFRLAAEQGNPYGRYYLGLAYLWGRGVSKDLTEAHRWQLRAAEQGYDLAQNSLGGAFERGEYEVGKDINKAVNYYRLAAEQGNASAQYSLGKLYSEGRGVPMDRSEAIKWYVRAANAGAEGKEGLVELGLGTKGAEFRYWDLAGGVQQRRFELPLKSATSRVSRCAVSPSGGVTLVDVDGESVLLEPGTGARTRTLIQKAGDIVEATFDEGKLYTFVAGSDLTSGHYEPWNKSGKLWDVAHRKPLLDYTGDAPEWSLQQQRLITRTSKLESVVRDTTTGQRLRTFRLPERSQDAFWPWTMFSPGGRRALTIDTGRFHWQDEPAKRPGEMILWDVESGRVIQQFSGHKDYIRLAHFSADGRRLLSVAGDKQTIIWDVDTGRTLKTIPLGFMPDEALFTPDGKQILLKAVRVAVLFDADSGQLVRRFDPENVKDDEVSRSFFIGLTNPTTLFSRNGTLLVTQIRMPDNSHFLHVWDVASGKPFYSRKASGYVSSVSISDDGRQLITVAGGGPAGHSLTRLWDIATGDVLASIFAANDGQDWLAVTPEGLFDGSEGGRQQVCYRIGGGLNVVPVDRFYQDFYRPGLIATLRRGERPLPGVKMAQALPPLVKIVTPSAGQVLETARLNLEVELVDQGGGIEGPWLMQNGSRILAKSESQQEENRLFRKYEIALTEGENRLEVRAASADGSWESEPARVTVTYGRPLVKPDLYILAAGVDLYAEGGLNLKFATGDAQAVCELFQRQGKALYQQVHTRLLLNEQATRSGIRQALTEIAKEARPQDTLLVYLAGHGTVVGQRYFFIGHDFARQAGKTLEEDVRSQGLAADVLGDWLASVPALKRMLILDTCHAGGAIGLVKTSRDPFAFRGAIERLSRLQGVFTIAAAAAGDEAQEVADLKHGVLTYSLLAAFGSVESGPLEGKSLKSNNPDRVADVLEWFSYASGQVPRLTTQFFGRSQEVQIGTQGQSFPVLPTEAN